MHPLVSPSWLKSRLAEPRVVVMDGTLPPVGVVPVVDVRGRYLERHIPGAVFFNIEALSDKGTTLPHMLASPEVFAESMAELGVGSGDVIVVYEQVGVLSAPRVRWTLRTYGAREVYVLDGGLEGWLAEGLPVESGEVRRERAEFAAEFDRGAVRSFAEVRGLLAEGGQVVDARSAGRFAGTAPEPRAGLRSGHMPRAMNVPYGELVEGGRMRDVEGMRAVFAVRGVDLTRPVTTTCGSGVSAAVLAMGMEMCGATGVSVYDGSWTEWAQRPEAEIAGGQ